MLCLLLIGQQPIIGKAIANNLQAQNYDSNLGNILQDEGKLEATIENYEINPDYFEAYNNIGYALELQG